MSNKQKIINSITISSIFIIVYLIMVTFFPEITLGWFAPLLLITMYNLGLWLLN